MGNWPGTISASVNGGSLTFVGGSVFYGTSSDKPRDIDTLLVCKAPPSHTDRWLREHHVSGPECTPFVPPHTELTIDMRGATIDELIIGVISGRRWAWEVIVALSAGHDRVKALAVRLLPYWMSIDAMAQYLSVRLPVALQATALHHEDHKVWFNQTGWHYKVGYYCLLEAFARRAFVDFLSDRDVDTTVCHKLRQARMGILSKQEFCQELEASVIDLLAFYIRDGIATHDDVVRCLDNYGLSDTIRYHGLSNIKREVKLKPQPDDLTAADELTDYLREMLTV